MYLKIALTDYTEYFLLEIFMNLGMKLHTNKDYTQTKIQANFPLLMQNFNEIIWISTELYYKVGEMLGCTCKSRGVGGLEEGFVVNSFFNFVFVAYLKFFNAYPVGEPAPSF